MISSGGWHKFRRGVALVAAVIGTAGVVAVPGAAGAASASRPVVDSGSPLAGPIGGGGRVTVFGSGFGSGDSVLFGSARAPQVHVISAHKLVATTPRHAAGTVSLRVRGPGGTSRAALSFTFVAPPTLTWSKAHRIDPPSGPPQTISCTGPKFCMATGKQGDVVRWNGSTWTRPTMLSRPGFQTRVSCSSPSFCVVLGQDLRIHIWDGHAWRQGPRRSNLDMDFAPDEVSGLDRLSCAPGHHYCVLTAPYIPKKSGWFRIDGHHLTLLGAPRHQRTDNQNQQPLSVSCAAAGHCVGTYLGGYVSTFDHGTFSTTRIAGHGKHPYISCASTKACVATDACVEDEGPPPPCVPDGLAVLRNGNWTETSTGTGVTLKDLSCPTGTTCVALHGRDSYTFDPVQPTRVRKQDIGAGKDLTGLSCPAADFCVAVDSDPGSAYRRSGGADRPWHPVAIAWGGGDRVAVADESRGEIWIFAVERERKVP